MSKPPQELLQPLLRDAEAELRRRLHEACESEARGIENESASEIRQLEDALLSAAVAAENTLTLRRHIKRHDVAQRTSDRAATAGETASASKPPGSTGISATESSGAVTTGLREFTDSAGESWRAWAVTPGLSRMGRTKHFLGEYQLGWVCFENPTAGARRRLPGHPERWSELSERDLDLLLQQAIAVRERFPKRPDTTVARPAG
jgi:hypothetical protein